MQADQTPGKKKNRARAFRYPAPLPAPCFSSCLYVRINPRDAAMFRFLLEAEDNLAYMSAVDRWACVLRVTYSPHQKKAVLRYLETMRERIEFTVIMEGADADA